jgi:hypothetical protein
MTTQGVPDGIPVLSRGKHRNARRGACFMEMASVLANEPWSDHPRCTDPLLAELARQVNDHTSDTARGELAPMIPWVIDVHSTGFAWDVSVTAAIATAAIPHARRDLQRALAAGLVRCRQLADLLRLETEQIDAALDLVPEARDWAWRHADGSAITQRQLRRRTAPSVVRCAVRGVATGSPDPDEPLRQLLTAAIDAAWQASPRPDQRTGVRGERRPGAHPAQQG